MMMKFADDSDAYAELQNASLVPVGGVLGTAAGAGAYGIANKLLDHSVNRKINAIYESDKTRGLLGRLFDSSAAKHRAKMADRLKAQFHSTARGKASRLLKHPLAAGAIGLGGGAIGALFAAGKQKQVAQRSGRRSGGE